MRKHITPKALLRPLCLFLALLGVACEKDQLEGDCVMGMIPENIVYKMRYGDCYPNSIWVEVLNDKIQGVDLTLLTVSPVLHPIHPNEYFNIVEVIFTDDFLTNYPITELVGKKIYFKYRQPSEKELEAAHPEQCRNLEEVYQTPIVVATDWSFDRCPTIP